MTEIITFFRSNPIFSMAFISGLIISFASGIMGSYVVIKRLSSITGSIAHSILGGIGLAIWLSYKYNIEWLTPTIGAIIFAVLSALLIGIVHLKYREREDAIIAIIWSSGMALGIIFLSLTPNFTDHCTDFLFGDIFKIVSSDIHVLIILDIIIFLIVGLFYRKFLAVCFDEDQAKLQKVQTNLLYLLLLVLIGISIVLMIQIIGIILVIALLTIPATIANKFSYRLPIIMLSSIILTAVFNLSGVTLSYLFNWPPGAVIALISTIFYIGSLTIKKFN